MLKKLSILIVVMFAGFSFWLLEPYALNPFHKLAEPKVKDTYSFTCQLKHPNIKADANEVITNYMLSNQFVGVAAGVFKEGCGSYIGASGYSNKRDLTHFSSDTINRIASITKPMTAIAIMQLYESNLIELDKPITDYLENLPEKYKAVTIKQLLNHTSGIPHYSSTFDALSFTHYETFEHAVKKVVERGFISEPGTAYLYSSFGYILLGQIIEKVSEMDFEEYLSKHIWQKAGMANTSLEYQKGPQKSRLYIKAGELYVRSPYTDLSLIYAAGGVQSTAEDLMKFGQAILQNKLISRASLELMVDVSQALTPSDGSELYGLGWSVYHSPKNGVIFSHGGAQPGVSAHFQILLDKGVIAFAISNAFGTKRSAYLLANELGSLML